MLLFIFLFKFKNGEKVFWIYKPYKSFLYYSVGNGHRERKEEAIRQT